MSDSILHHLQVWPALAVSALAGRSEGPSPQSRGQACMPQCWLRGILSLHRSSQFNIADLTRKNKQNLRNILEEMRMSAGYKDGDKYTWKMNKNKKMPFALWPEKPIMS